MTNYYLDGSERSDLSYRDRIGEPDEIDASLGRVVLGFSEVEDAVSCVISMLIGSGLSIGQIVTSGMSFRVKMDVLGSLARLQLESQGAVREELDQLNELIKICRSVEQKRNRVIHSAYLSGFQVKTTAGAKRGLRSVVSLVSSAEFMDTADYCGYVAEMVEGYPVVLGLATSVEQSESELKYHLVDKDGAKQEVFVFKKISERPSIGT